MVRSWLALILASLAVVSTPTPSAGDDIQVRVYPLTTHTYAALENQPLGLGDKNDKDGEKALGIAAYYFTYEELATIEVEAPPGGLGDDAPLQKRLREEVHSLGGNAFQIKSATVYTNTDRYMTITGRAYRIYHPRTGRPIPFLHLVQVFMAALSEPGTKERNRCLQELQHYAASPEKEDALADALEKMRERRETWERERDAHPYGKTFADIETEVDRSTGTSTVAIAKKRRQFRQRVAELRKREWSDDVLYAELYRIFEVAHGTSMAAEILEKPRPAAETLEPPSPATGARPFPQGRATPR